MLELTVREAHRGVMTTGAHLIFQKALASDENKAAFYALPVFLSGILMYNLIFHLLGST